MNKGKLENYWSLILLIAVFTALLFVGNYIFAQNEPGGADFLYRWLPTRLVFVEGYDNPYSDQVELEVELVHHGHAREGKEIPGMFAYPYHTMFALLPFALIKDFVLARVVWMTTMQLAHIGMIFLSTKMIGYKPTKPILLGLILFAIFTADFFQALIDGNPSSLAALFAILSLFFLSRKSDAWAGVFLALSTIKPQMVILFFVLVWVWAFSKKRLMVIYFSLVTMLFLLGASFFLQPNWLSEFIKDITTYTGTASPSTPRAILSYWMSVHLADTIAWGLTILSLFILAYAWTKSYARDFPVFLWAASITFATMHLIGITSAKSNYIAMLPGVILLLQYGTEKLKSKSFWLGILLVIWIGFSWIFFYAGRTWIVGDNLIYFLDFYPLPILLLSLYYFIRPSKNGEMFSEENI